MFRNAKSKLDVSELTRRGFMTYRKLFLMLLGACVFFYLLPPVFRYMFMNAPEKIDPLVECMSDRLTPFFMQNFEYDANILHSPPLPEEKNFIPYVGNGYIGLQVTNGASLNIKFGRSMQLPIEFYPILTVTKLNEPWREATVVEYLTGIVHRFECLSTYFVSYAFYAHRVYPSILMQEIKITNTRNTIEQLKLILPRWQNLKDETRRTVQLGSVPQEHGFKDFDVVTGIVSPKFEKTNPEQFIVISIVKPIISNNVQFKKRGSVRLLYPIAIHYSKPVQKDKVTTAIEDTEKKSIQAMTRALQKLESENEALAAYRQEHINVWKDLWATGFTISTSKAEGSLNGDRINATMYAVLSQVRSYEFEEYVSVSAPTKMEITKALTYAEGCYDSYHTLQAENLWLGMDTLTNLNNLISSWMLTLEKQGCHNLIRAGASGVIQAMVLSFGSFRFSNQHLECNMHPKYLHRDFHFRRLNYGNKTHVNVTITVKDDNKAIIEVALDRSDRSYYACDGGCLDEPILLTQSRRIFPVKLTDPLTAILYITEDKQHMEELNKAIHVKEVVEAPAHEQHVIALHKHGHQLGGLPTLFWVSVCAIIIVFHIFLCKLIIKEYCEPSEKLRYRYNKP